MSLLFIIFINDIDDGIVSKISKFADDTKLWVYEEEAEKLREDLRRMFRWPQDSQMLFNLEKVLNDAYGELKVSEEDRNLGEIMHKSANLQGNVLKQQKSLTQL